LSGHGAENTPVGSSLSVRCSTLEPARDEMAIATIFPPRAVESYPGAIEASLRWTEGRANGRKPWLSAGVIDGAQTKETPMLRYLAVFGALAAFAGAPAMAQQPTAPGQMMHKSSVPTTKGASAYAPGHLKKHRVAIKGRPGASGFAPGHAASNINTRSRVTTGSRINTQSGMTTGSSFSSGRIDSDSQR